MMYYPMYFDPTYILVLMGVVICWIVWMKRKRKAECYEAD